MGFDLSRFQPSSHALRLAIWKAKEPNALGHFNASLAGFEARLHGAEIHEARLGQDCEFKESLIRVEAIVGDLFFNYEAAVESLVFAVNAAGTLLDEGFGRIDTAAALRAIGPNDVLGGRNAADSRVFPVFTDAWRRHASEPLAIVKDNHDITKHRSTVVRGADIDLQGEPKSLGELLQTPIKFKNIKIPREPKIETPDDRGETMSVGDLVDLRSGCMQELVDGLAEDFLVAAKRISEAKE